jgi:hypothetical protein
MIELCVRNDQGLADFVDIMRSIAVSEHMMFVDGGAQTQQELRVVGSKFEKLDTPGSVLNFGLERGNDPVIMGDNLGLPQYQIVLGFSGNAEPAEMHRLANVVEQRLGELWQVITVPDGTGALPMNTCPGKI